MVSLANQDIRTAIKDSGFTMWLIGSKIGWNDSQFSRKLRFELSRDEKQRIYEVIKNLKKQRG